MKKIFIVDDDLLSNKLLHEVCLRRHEQVESIVQPLELMSLDLDNTSLIFLDLVMPQFDGVEVIRYLAKQRCQAALVLMSGSDMSVLHCAQMLAEEQGINIMASITKPFSVDEVLSLIERFLQSNFYNDSRLLVAEKEGLPISKSQLWAAITERQLVMYYQPQLQISSGRLFGVEALVRWQHPDRGLIYPDEFIPLAEEFGFLAIMTEEILRLVALQVARWRNEDMEPRVSINIPACLMSDLDFPEYVSQYLSEYALNEDLVTFELTETTLISGGVSSLDILTRIRLKGIHLSIDDFGTGFSSLSQLYRMPFNELKIDLSFVRRMDQDADCYAIVENCVQLGHQLNMQVVAEGVENIAILKMLEELGCDVAQGYYFSKPLSGKDLVTWNHQILAVSH
jgi:EAL domain-containing protein (putative c-di-GMP-specific phosphodiesterase class I)/CheY-like chemotaxis protein